MDVSVHVFRVDCAWCRAPGEIETCIRSTYDLDAIVEASALPVRLKGGKISQKFDFGPRL